jgi:hypothetical protein
MNLKKNKTKKDLVIEMIKELAKLQSQVPENAANKLNYILNGFLKDNLDFEMGIRYVDNSMKESKEIPMKIFWIQVTQIIKKYFKASKLLK